ncbi:hypothetical protein QW3_1386 [Clostridioides difficile P74]|nr:hypothetical protein QG7_1533 [Clostridioides difficile CD175]EQK32906.1 hypothetical protein QW3_1386 [Clostridioides difficile P74]
MFYINYMECKFGNKYKDSDMEMGFILTIWNVNYPFHI